MKRLMLVIACGILVGCDYTVPLVRTPEMKIDPSVLGLWERTKEDGDKESLVVLPLGQQEYLVSFPSESIDAMFARACLCVCAGKTLVQLEWIGSAQGSRPEGGRAFQYAMYSIKGESIAVRMLNTEVVKKEVNSSVELAKLITDNKDAHDLFGNEMVLKKVKK